MHCCEAWEPVGTCFDQNSFECIDFHGLSQIISLTRERITEREAEMKQPPLDTDGKRRRLGEVQTWSSRVTLQETNALMKPTILWKTKTNRTGGYVNICSTIFKARVEGERAPSP